MPQCEMVLHFFVSKSHDAKKNCKGERHSHLTHIDKVWSLSSLTYVPAVKDLHAAFLKGKWKFQASRNLFF